jgi:hypothetical protein
LDEFRWAMIGRNRGIRAKEGESVGRLLATVLRKADESGLGRAMVEITILLAAFDSQFEFGNAFVRDGSEAHASAQLNARSNSESPMICQ